MGCRKIGIVLLILTLVLAGSAFADENTMYLKKKGSLAFKFGTGIYPDSDFTDSWDLDPEKKFLPLEVAYEHKFGDTISLEFALGYKKMEDKSVHTNGAAAEVDAANMFFTPSLKYNIHMGDSAVLFLGAGGGIFSNRGTLSYNLRSGTTAYNLSADVSHTTWSAHGLIGFEYFVLKNPAEMGLYDIPVSIGLEYKYTYAEIEDYDEDLVKQIRNIPGYNNAPFSKADVGGHTLAFLVKWYLY